MEQVEQVKLEQVRRPQERLSAGVAGQRAIVMQHQVSGYTHTNTQRRTRTSARVPRPLSAVTLRVAVVN